jgi:proteasome accessory factor A
MERASELASRSGSTPPILLYKNNTDNKGASYGTHENYLMRRTTPFSDIVRHLTPFFITRQVFTGSGRLGVGQDGRSMRYQLTQRADFFEVEVGLETTLKRPIINTRDEPHADPEKYRRLHVIVGDANLCDVATYLKMGTTSIVLAMIEDGALDQADLMPRNPVREMHAVSHDTTLQHRLVMNDGSRRTAIEIQEQICTLARAYCAQQAAGDIDEQTLDVLDRWSATLAGLAADPMTCATTVDWVAKLSLLEEYRARDGLDWSAHRLQAIDLQYSDVRRDKGLAARLEARGRLARLFSDDEVDRAMSRPPHDTRAYFRGECLRRYPEQVAAASWDSVVFDIPGQESLLRVPTLEPLRGTREHVGALLDACPTPQELIAALSVST